MRTRGVPRLIDYVRRLRRTAFAPAAGRRAAAGAADPVRHTDGRSEVPPFFQGAPSALEPALRRSFPKVSVIVLTYNNLALTKLCLASLQERVEWPLHEIVIVDNASADGTREYLRAFEAGSNRVHLVLNGENRGFAAANNQALRAVSGECVVLLNNDTILTRGSLTALLRHLHRDPTIGLIGPVTNGTGNEARIQVGYTTITELAAWAQHWMQAHDGELFDIPMLAMYCVAMRREVLDQVGLLDERFGVGMFEDDDYARRVRDAGYRVVCARDSYVHHWQRAAFGMMADDEYRRLVERNRRAFEEKWGRPWIPHSYAASTAFTD